MAFVDYELGNNDEAAILAEYAARRLHAINPELARESARLALAAYEQEYEARSPEQRPVMVRIARPVASSHASSLAPGDPATNEPRPDIFVTGQIDRLAVTAQAVLIGDYKTNRDPPRSLDAVPPAYVDQLALYRALLSRIYADRPIKAVLVWTEIPDLMELPAAMLDAALARLSAK